MLEQPISRVFTVAKLVVILLLLVFINGFRGDVDVPIFRTEGVGIKSVSDLGVPLPWGAFNIWLFFALVLNVLHLAYRRWMVETRWIELGLGLFALGIWWSIFQDARDVLADGVPLPELDANAQQGLAGVILAALAIPIVVNLITSVVRGFRLRKHYRASTDGVKSVRKPKNELERTLRRDWADVYDFYLDEDTRARLPEMNVIERGVIVAFELVKGMTVKLTVARRILFIIAAVTFVQGLPAAKWVGLLLFLWILLLELKDKLLAHDELAVGRAVQSALLPEPAPAIPGWEVWLFNRPAREVSGDVVDYLKLDSERWAISLGDVSGKGLGAALLSAQLQATLRALAPSTDSLVDLGRETNAIVYRDSPRDRFASLIYIELRESSGELRVLNAGHPPCIIARENELETMPLGKPAFGLVPDVAYREDRIDIAPGDMVIVYSDGLTDAMNEGVEFFGEARLMELVPPLRAQTAARAGSDLLRAVETFVDGASQHDDLSLVVLRRLPPPG